MSLKRINVGPRLSEVAVFNNVAYFAGVVPDNTEADITDQTRDVLAQIDALLKEVGSDKTKLLQCQSSLPTWAHSMG